MQVAAKGLNLILVARRVEKLEELAAQIRASYGVEGITFPFDLSVADAAAQLQKAVAGRDLGLVVFNAGGDSVGDAFLKSRYAMWHRSFYAAGSSKRLRSRAKSAASKPSTVST